MPSLLQETVVAGPPVEVQVRVNTGGSVAGSVSNWKVMSPGIVTWPVGGKDPSHTCSNALTPPPTILVVLLPTIGISYFLKLPHL